MSQETKKCPYCGKEILAVAKKCKHCGTWLDGRGEAKASTPATPKQDSPVNDTPIDKSAKKSSKGKLGKTIISAIVGIAVLSGGAYFYIQHTDKVAREAFVANHIPTALDQKGDDMAQSLFGNKYNEELELFRAKQSELSNYLTTTYVENKDRDTLSIGGDSKYKKLNSALQERITVLSVYRGLAVHLSAKGVKNSDQVQFGYLELLDVNKEILTCIHNLERDQQQAKEEMKAMTWNGYAFTDKWINSTVNAAEHIAELYEKRDNIGSLLSITKFSDIQKKYEKQILDGVSKSIDLKYNEVFRVAGEKLTQEDFLVISKERYEVEYLAIHNTILDEGLVPQ